MTVRWDGDEALREIGWIAHEARAIEAEDVDADTERWAEYILRKRALLEYVEQERMSRNS